MEKETKVDLINYLQAHYLTEQELLALAKVTESELLAYQQQNVMPSCSYTLEMDCKSDSFFGVFNEKSNTRYYAKGYVSWLDVIKSSSELQDIYTIFSQRYRAAVEHLQSLGYCSTDEKVNSKLSLHIEQEWGHFLNGTYGLCTKSGLPEDIAGKEIAILLINESLTLDDSQKDLAELTHAVDLLDVSSAMFAPHERLNSSRHRLVNEVRRVYKLKSNTGKV